MRRVPLIVGILLLLSLSNQAWAWGYQGHRVVGSIAGQMLNDRAKVKVSQILGFELRIAGPWADCVKCVVKNDDGTFSYQEDPSHPSKNLLAANRPTPTSLRGSQSTSA